MKGTEGKSAEHIEIIEVTPQNVEEYGVGCIRNKKHPGVRSKIEWYRENFHTGLRIKLLFRKGKLSGFIEYVNGENAWRPVIADNYLFIHCIWVYSTKSQGQGLGSQLIRNCIEDARGRGRSGVVTVTSRGSWLADERLFIQNGFENISSRERFDLLLYEIKKDRLPEFIKWDSYLDEYQGWHLITAHQCPAIAKAIEDMERVAKEESIHLNIKLLKTNCEAKRAPSGYGVFQLVHDGKVLEDHYISGTRFRNIVRKEEG